MYSGLFSPFPGTQIMPSALEWEIMSMQILLREGFYSLKRNLPLGNWTVFFPFTTTCSCTHEQAIPVRGCFLIQITKNTRQRLINIRVTSHFTRHHN